MKSESIQQLSEMIKTSSKIVAFSGAGVSTESGISDYRSQGGLWERYQPVTIQEFVSSEEKRREYWLRKKEMYAQILLAKPNPAHLALAALEKEGKLLGVITQNIDGLHRDAGNKNVLEIHGTNREVICLDCKQIGPFDPVYERLLQGEEIPLCQSCEGLLKPNTISFGQALDFEVLDLAVEWSRKCDLMLALGSTLIVEPAASIPRMAKQARAKLAIINREPTPLDAIADLVVTGSVGEIFEAIKKS
jgi:NAD-dependent deacetylase